MFDADVFWSKLIKGRFDNDCWLFRYQRDGFHVQYAPYFVVEGKSIQAHRIAYALTYGTLPAGFVVRHRCGGGGCCNPAHLVLGTQQQNSWDRYAREWAGIEMGVLATYEDIPEYRPR